MCLVCLITAEESRLKLQNEKKSRKKNKYCLTGASFGQRSSKHNRSNKQVEDEENQQQDIKQRENEQHGRIEQDGDNSVRDNNSETEDCVPEVLEDEENEDEESSGNESESEAETPPAEALAIHYFAFGAMTNMTAVSLRELTPISSQPAILKGYRLLYLGSGGMATAEREGEYELLHDQDEMEYPFDCIHGVLHLLSAAHMKILDDFEGKKKNEKNT